MADDLSVSSRCITALKPPIPYLTTFLDSLDDQFHPTDNPKGFISLCVAENKLIVDMIIERMLDPATTRTVFSNEDNYTYADFSGIRTAREALSYFFAKRFYMPGSNMTMKDAHKHILPSNIAIGAGCAAFVGYSFYLLGEKGDACLIPAPYYAAFDTDINVVAGCVPYPMYMENPSEGPTPDDLEKAFQAAKSDGHRVRFLLLTNPNNPLGTIYSPETLTNAVEWARNHKMHTIVDEIYALSKYGDGPEFHSIIRVLDNELGDDVHMLWALSKDFGASGLRVGSVYSQNKHFMEALANINIFSAASNPMQAVLENILTNDDFVDRFLVEARKRLRNSYEMCTKILEETNIPYVPAVAGLFVYVDMSSLLCSSNNNTFEAEAELVALMSKHAKLILTPGAAQHEKRPGMFRICFAWVKPNVLRVAMQRLTKLAAAIQSSESPDLKALESIL